MRKTLNSADNRKLLLHLPSLVPEPQQSTVGVRAEVSEVTQHPQLEDLVGGVDHQRLPLLVGDHVIPLPKKAELEVVAAVTVAVTVLVSFFRSARSVLNVPADVVFPLRR